MGLKLLLFLAALLGLAQPVRGQGLPPVRVVDTDFSKGRLGHEQQIAYEDLVRLHGHSCDGLVLGYRALRYALLRFYPQDPIDRTNLRCWTGPSPCLVDAAQYLTGGRSPYGTLIVSDSLGALFWIERLDDGRVIELRLRPGVKPAAIDSLGALAVARKLAPCDLDRLRELEDRFAGSVLQASDDALFELVEHWVLPQALGRRQPAAAFRKTDVLNKDAPPCRR